MRQRRSIARQVAILGLAATLVLGPLPAPAHAEDLPPELQEYQAQYDAILWVQGWVNLSNPSLTDGAILIDAVQQFGVSPDSDVASIDPNEAFITLAWAERVVYEIAAYGQMTRANCEQARERKGQLSRIDNALSKIAAMYAFGAGVTVLANPFVGAAFATMSAAAWYAQAKTAEYAASIPLPSSCN